MQRLIACWLLAGTCVTAAAADRPNILFIFTDDHCEQALSAYDPAKITTPNLDRIAKEGMRFDRCYVTNSICGPSRAVIQTGKYSHLNGFVRNGNKFDGSQQTFPKLLQAAEYQTAVIGKWHLATTPQGYDYYDVLIGQGPYYNPPMLTAGPNGEPITRKHTGYTTDIIADKALTWLKEGRDEKKPFMLMCQHKAPHRNWMPGPKYLNWLDDVTIPEPETLWDDYSGRTQSAARQQMTVRQHLNDNDLKLTKAGGRLTEEQTRIWEAAYGPKNAVYLKARPTMSEEEIVKWKYQRYVKDYLRCVKSVDDSVGLLLDYLDESGLAENTVVIYSSDQGWYLGEHGWFDKRWMYEESLKTPLMIRWPGKIQPGSTHGAIVSNLDFAETFLDIAGTQVPDDMQGRSLVSLFDGSTPDDWRQTFYYHYYENPGAHNVARHYGVTNGKHKLIRFYALEGKPLNDWELFDLEKDPNELQSVYDSPDYRTIQAELQAELKVLRERLQVPEDTNIGRQPAVR